MGLPERGIPSLGAMGWGSGGGWKFFRRVAAVVRPTKVGVFANRCKKNRFKNAGVDVGAQKNKSNT